MMTVLEFLSTTKHIYEQLKIYRISASDVVYVEMVKEYNQMVAEGRKESSVKALMERKYKLSASTVRGAIKRLNRELDVRELPRANQKPISRK